MNSVTVSAGNSRDRFRVFGSARQRAINNREGRYLLLQVSIRVSTGLPRMGGGLYLRTVRKHFGRRKGASPRKEKPQRKASLRNKEESAVPHHVESSRWFLPRHEGRPPSGDRYEIERLRRCPSRRGLEVENLGSTEESHRIARAPVSIEANLRISVELESIVHACAFRLAASRTVKRNDGKLRAAATQQSPPPLTTISGGRMTCSCPAWKKHWRHGFKSGDVKTVSRKEDEVIG